MRGDWIEYFDARAQVMVTTKNGGKWWGLKFEVKIAQVFDINPVNKLWELLYVAFVSASPAIAAENEESIGKQE